MKTAQTKTIGRFLVIPTLLIFIISAGTGLSKTGAAYAQESVNTDEMLTNMPVEMPADYTNEDISRMLEDVQQIDDSSDVEGREESEPPEISENDRELAGEIQSNPDEYSNYIKDAAWLDAHPAAIWLVCSDFRWIDAHPQFAARIYLNYHFWYQHPKIAYLIVSNRPFLVRYPRITLVIYNYDAWFILHPFIAREVFRNYAIFMLYPALYQRYYRHQQWIWKHPGIVRVAYGNRALLAKHPQGLREVYRYRRYAVQHRVIRTRHLATMQKRLKASHERNRIYRERKKAEDKNRARRTTDKNTRVRYKDPKQNKAPVQNKTRNRDNTRNQQKEKSIQRDGASHGQQRKPAASKNQGERERKR
jgi:hypothetical protein